MSTRTLTTTLPSGTLYVSGTVNGVSTTWTNTEGRTRETVAERSPEDVYVVAITIINQLGTATETTFTLYYGLHLVTDRTQADVNARNAKGTYNASDLNRVGAAVEYIVKRLYSIGYVVNVYPRTDWKSEDFPNASDAKACLSNISALRNVLVMPEETPSVPVDMNGFTYSEANNIEQILKIIEDSINRMVDANIYCGEFCGGEV